MFSREDIQASAAGQGVAAFQLAQFAFNALVQSGIIPKDDAIKTLKRAIQANKSGGPRNKVAAEMLAIVLKSISEFQPATRQ
jgi:hypothetical protein